MSQQLETLALALESIKLSPTKAPHRIAFMRAQFHPALLRFKHDDFTCHQTFKPDYDKLADAELTVTADTLNGEYDMIIYLATRQQAENRANLVRGLSHLADEGVFITVQANDLGAKSLEKDLKALAPVVEVFSKNHCRAMWTYKTPSFDQDLMAKWLAVDAPQIVNGSTLFARPGMFSWQKVDRGSAVLLQCLPSDLRGNGADFGAGWGYLSHHLLHQDSGIESLAVVEAEKLALDLAESNLKPLASKATIHLVWADLARDTPVSNLDFIIMNPPQHSVNDDDVDLTPAFIRHAHKALKNGGRLYMVASTHLPVEAVLRAHFGEQVTRLCQQDGFKVLAARR